MYVPVHMWYNSNNTPLLQLTHTNWHKQYPDESYQAEMCPLLDVTYSTVTNTTNKI